MGLGWDCGASNGEGLSRVLANDMYPGVEPANFMSAPVCPAKTPERCCCPAASALTHRVPLSLNATLSLLARFTQTMSVGGSSLTLQTADAVKPTGPLRTTQVTIFTAAPRRAMASRNIFRSTIMWDYF